MRITRAAEGNSDSPEEGEGLSTFPVCFEIMWCSKEGLPPSEIPYDPPQQQQEVIHTDDI